MSVDKYPWRMLRCRIIDISLFAIAAASLIIAVAIGVLANSPEQRWVIGLGMVASLIGALLDYRQKNHYDRNHEEGSLLSDGLTAPYLNQVAKLRHKLVSSSVLVVVGGVWVSGYGAVWGGA